MPPWRRNATLPWPLIREPATGSAEDWSGQAKGGRNGLAIFIVALSWWLAKKKGLKGAESIIEDLTWSLGKINDMLAQSDPGHEVREPNPRLLMFCTNHLLRLLSFVSQQSVSRHGANIWTRMTR
jgi:hypothetical protein